VPVDSLTEGAACTAVLAKELINDHQPLIIANSDQFVQYDKRNFEVMRRHGDVDGIIFSFNACHPKWSFARLDEKLEVVEVAEKRPISNVATCGLYYFRTGLRFVRAAEAMIAKDIRTNGEFYIAPVFNEMIEQGDIVLPFFVDRMLGLGTPEDLEVFLTHG
jgi:dTDP-glucose pyrophosphorylase